MKHIKSIRILRKWWRKHGAKLIVLFIIISGYFLWNEGVGICCFLMLTVPCGIVKINTTKWLWYSRQFYFLIIGILYLII